MELEGIPGRGTFSDGETDGVPVGSATAVSTSVSSGAADGEGNESVIGESVIGKVIPGSAVVPFDSPAPDCKSDVSEAGRAALDSSSDLLTLSDVFFFTIGDSVSVTTATALASGRVATATRRVEDRANSNRRKPIERDGMLVEPDVDWLESSSLTPLSAAGGLDDVDSSSDSVACSVGDSVAVLDSRDCCSESERKGSDPSSLESVTGPVASESSAGSTVGRAVSALGTRCRGSPWNRSQSLTELASASNLAKVAGVVFEIGIRSTGIRFLIVFVFLRVVRIACLRRLVFGRLRRRFLRWTGGRFWRSGRRFGSVVRNVVVFTHDRHPTAVAGFR